MDCVRERIADYNLIRTGAKFELWRPEDAQAEHQLSVAWLQRELVSRPADKTIVISHFPPSMGLRHQGFPEDEFTPYFNANLDDLIEQRQPRYWLYGHNHWSDRQRIGQTELISNQLGYPDEKNIPKFTSRILLDLAD